MRSDDPSGQPAQDSIQDNIQDGVADDSVTLDATPACDVKPACTALVPVVEAAQWSPRRPLPRPDSIFVTHLIATIEQAPQTRSLRRATASDARAAYTANQHRVAGAGLRARQIA